MSTKKGIERQQLRFETTYHWAMGAELQELNQILKGVQKEIRVGDVVTGVSNNDKNAIELALKRRI